MKATIILLVLTYSLFFSFWPQLCYRGFSELGLNGFVFVLPTVLRVLFQQLVRDGALAVFGLICLALSQRRLIIVLFVVITLFVVAANTTVVPLHGRV